jgi:hypothetical protein
MIEDVWLLSVYGLAYSYMPPGLVGMYVFRSCEGAEKWARNDPLWDHQGAPAWKSGMTEDTVVAQSERGVFVITKMVLRP